MARAATKLDAVAREAAGCRRCDLWREATQAVFGDGVAPARIMLVGEQPGDQEDLQGKPFVGPAGHLLDRALAEAGLDRGSVYITNAVKHFKFKRSGKRRLHKRPNNGEIDICRWWLTRELEIVRPKVVVAMGVTALRGVMGKSLKLGESRGRTLELPDGMTVIATAHPSSVLRQRDHESRTREFRALVADLAKAGRTPMRGR